MKGLRRSYARAMVSRTVPTVDGLLEKDSDKSQPLQAFLKETFRSHKLMFLRMEGVPWKWTRGGEIKNLLLLGVACHVP